MFVHLLWRRGVPQGQSIRGHSYASATQICVKSHSRTSPQKQRVQSGRRKRDRDPRVPCFCSAHTHTHVCVCKNRSRAFSHLCEVTRPSPSSTCIRSAHLCVMRLTNATNRNRGPVLVLLKHTHVCVCDVADHGLSAAAARDRNNADVSV